MGSVALSEIRDAFLKYLESERNLSAHTIRAYLGDLDSFFEHLEKLDVTDFSKLELSHIRSWLASQQVKGGARTTLSRRAVSIRLFTKWATKKGYLAKDVGSTLATPKGARTLPDVLTVADASLAMDAMAARVGEEDGRAILGAHVGSLAVELRGVVGHGEEHGQQGFVGHHGRVEGDLHGFGVSGPAAGHGFVVGVYHGAADVA